MNRQAILDVLNSLKVVDMNGGDDAYLLVDNSEEVRQKLNAVGVTEDVIQRYGDDDSFCVLALAFGEKYADGYEKGKFVLWGPIDDEFRDRVLNGEGTAMDAERLLRALEPEVFGKTEHWIVWDNEDGLIGTYESYDDALKDYENAKSAVERYVREEGEFSTDEEVIIAKIQKHFYSHDTEKAVMKYDEDDNEVPTGDTYWDFTEDDYTKR
ncbi:hypothetical protein [Brevibacillus sp. DP1.3A]|uniref:hypothetical protein n=1 Tax=Brevibacillus sp. DP1.3A TaxID=2738867 RepID=UPI001D166318|nr:hypothetical protein [Brevibacillus sp. DP1.3A]UED78093.1 hypothetical protein HP399_030680 [Brevibacillus sp. DP1.3A]